MNDVVEGGHYAALRKGRQGFRRVRVISKLNNDVHVYYIDFGDEGIIPREDLRVLPLECVDLRAQAIRAQLHGERLYCL